MAPVESLSRDQLQVVKTYLERRASLDLATQEAFAEQLARPLLTALALTPEAIHLRYSDFLAQLVEKYEQQRLTGVEL
jgi:hypothetical protein